MEKFVGVAQLYFMPHPLLEIVQRLMAHPVDIDENPYSLEPTNRGKGFQSISRDSRLMAC